MTRLSPASCEWKGRKRAFVLHWMKISPPQRSPEPGPFPSCTEAQKAVHREGHPSSLQIQSAFQVCVCRRATEQWKGWESSGGYSGVIRISCNTKYSRVKYVYTLQGYKKGWQIHTQSSVRAFLSSSISPASFSSSNCLIRVALYFTCFKSKSFHSHPVFQNLGKPFLSTQLSAQIGSLLNWSTQARSSSSSTSCIAVSE